MMTLLTPPAAGTAPVLRDYQTEALAELLDRLSASPEAPVMLQLPTGGGKTEIAAALIAHWQQEETGRPIYFVVHRTELVLQTAARFARYGLANTMGSGPEGNWRPGTPPPGGLVVVCAQTIGARRHADLTPASAIFDEAHWYPGGAGFGRLISRFHGRIVGLTATPWRLSHTEAFRPPWAALVTGPQTRELIDRGYLADYVLKNLGGVVDKPAMSARWSDARKAAAWWGEAQGDTRGTLTSAAVDIWRRQAGGRQTICFALTTAHAHELVRLFNAGAGRRIAAAILADTPAPDRAEILDGFRSGALRVLVNVEILREGFDAPDADCLLVLRPTDSLALWRQMCGRVLRPKADGGTAVILDLVRNAQELGLPDQQMTWSLDARPEKGHGTAPTKVCPGQSGWECGAVYYLPVRTCSIAECRYEFGQVCPADQDGCGQWRGWTQWDGIRRLNPQVCTPCNDRLAEMQAMRDPLDARRIAYLLRQGGRRVWETQKDPGVYKTECPWGCGDSRFGRRRATLQFEDTDKYGLRVICWGRHYARKEAGLGMDSAFFRGLRDDLVNFVSPGSQNSPDVVVDTCRTVW